MGKSLGSRNTRSYRLAADKLEEGMRLGKPHPVEVMLENMWDAFEQALSVKGKTEKETLRRAALRKQAEEFACDVAPYCHPKLQNIEVNSLFPKEEKENKMVIEFINVPRKKD